MLIGLAAAGVALAVGLLPFLDTIELKTYDLRVRWTAHPDRARRDIVLVRIDEDSIQKLEPLVGRFPWPRLVHAQLVNYLARGPAKVVAYDVLFSERDRRSFTVEGEPWTGEESDKAFADAVRQAGNVVLAADASLEAAERRGNATTDGQAPAARANSPGLPAAALPGPAYRLDTRIEERPAILPPYEELSGAARAIGHVFTVLDPDGPVRRSVPFIRVGGRTIPSLALSAAMVAAGISPDAASGSAGHLGIGGRRMPLVEADIPSFYGERRRSVRSLIRFTGPVVSGGKPTYLDYSFYRLFYSEQQLLAGNAPLVDPAVFRDKIVLVGTTAAGLQDLFTVPFAEGKMPGMEVHANVIDNVLSSRFMQPAPAWVKLVTAAACALAVGFGVMLLGVWPGVAVALGVVAGLGGVSLVLFDRGLWIQVATAFVAVVLASFGGVAYQYFVEGREKRRIKHVFSRFVSRDVYDHLLVDPARVRLGGQRRDMTVLFSDIRGFTTVSEGGQPEEIVGQLNEYFTRMVEVVFRHQGTIDKFVGDMVMALFGAPLEDPDNADHAVGAALGMLVALEDLNRRWAAEGRPQLDIGIGINTGEMVAGNIGSEQIMSYTVIGDAVNLGSRLESLNKQYGTRIIISGQTRGRLKGRYDTQLLGEVVVKGKTKPVTIYEVRPGDADTGTEARGTES